MNPLQSAENKEKTGGLMLIAATALALLIANSPLVQLYEAMLSTDMSIYIGGFGIDKPLLLWINDGLMVLFFFLVGLEIKREILEGTLSRVDQAILPVVAAIGGIAVPAVIYALINRDNPAAISGWAIPAATDIAFVVGILALLGRRVPLSLKVFVLALAIIDDVGAILIIALFYTDGISTASLAAAGLATIALATLNRMRVVQYAPYIIVGVILWASVLKSGVHATLAGVLLAMFIPMRNPKQESHSPLRDLEDALHPSVAFAVLPIFAFANAGVTFAGLTWESVFNEVTLGIAAGLFLGKQIGVGLFAYAAVALGFAKKPEGSNWLQLYGVSALTGIGFTMSLFVGTLALDPVMYAESLRIGVLVGSALSAALGIAVLFYAASRTGKTARITHGD
ncbi:MAG: Na+/H+ antiporter NhaA, partial [Rhodospirillaceae bacterium]